MTMQQGAAAAGPARARGEKGEGAAAKAGHEAFAVYVHWPFCAAKCPYCDFNSHVRHGGVDQRGYGAALAREIAYMAAMRPGRTVASVFFGGGTPSLMEETTVGTVLEAIDRHWGIADGAEVTLEANPTSADASRFRGYRAAGVNRLSLGVQALDDVSLKFLGRLHTAREARRAVDLARATFARLSFDLIYARPDQTDAAWSAELRAAIAMAADHLSLYQLTIEEGTPFFDLAARGRLVVPDPERAAALYELTREITSEAGLPPYEISNHAVPGAESVHNLTYWRSGEWAGVGPGAHGRLAMNDGRHALSTQRNPEAWRRLVETCGHGLVEDETLGAEAVSDEYLIMGLRLVEGIDPARYEGLAGRSLSPTRIADLAAHGMIERTGDGRIRCTPAGFLVLDAVVADLAA